MMVFLNNKINARIMQGKHFENMENIDSNEEVKVNACGIDGVRRNSILGKK